MATKKEKTPEQMTDKQLANAFKEVCKQIISIQVDETDDLGEMKAMHDLYELALKGTAYSKEMDKRAAKGSKAFTGMKDFMDRLSCPQQKAPTEDKAVTDAVDTLAGALGIPSEELYKFVADCASPKTCKIGHCTCKKKAKKVPKEVQAVFDDLGVDVDDIAGYAMIDLDSGQFYSGDFSETKK